MRVLIIFLTLAAAGAQVTAPAVRVDAVQLFADVETLAADAGIPFLFVSVWTTWNTITGRPTMRRRSAAATIIGAVHRLDRHLDEIAGRRREQ